MSCVAQLGSVSTCKLKDCRYDSGFRILDSRFRSGHMPGLRVLSLVAPPGTSKKQPIDVSRPHQCFPSFLSPSLLLSLKVNT